MDDFPARLATLLESTAAKIRSLTIDRVAKVIRVTTLGIIAGALATMAGIFLFLTIYGALEIPLGRWGALAVLGGLFAAGGALLWTKRTKDVAP
jgi:hypothetical protein